MGNLRHNHNFCLEILHLYIMAGKCVHKACGKTFSDPEEECVYHPGPPVFHEGQKGKLSTLEKLQICAPRFT